jgi:hypothetical protein
MEAIVLELYVGRQKTAKVESINALKNFFPLFVSAGEDVQAIPNDSRFPCTGQRRALNCEWVCALKNIFLASL